MDKTITLRIDSNLQKSLAQAAQRQGKTISQCIRDLLTGALQDRAILSRTKHLKGRLELPEAMDDGWRRQIKKRNWRP